METTDSKDDLVNNAGDFMPGISIDCVIFGFHYSQLKVLLIGYGNSHNLSLAGGFVRRKEDVDFAAKRIVQERTGLSVVNLRLVQFGVFGSKNRLNNGKVMQKVLKRLLNITLKADHWLLQRFITIGYYALVDFTKAKASNNIFSESCEWHDINNRPKLMFDHDKILNQALLSLRQSLDIHLKQLRYLLPETFTMNELQGVYETIMNEKVLRPSFQRKILSMNILERLDKRWTGQAHKAPYLYRFI